MESGAARGRTACTGGTRGGPTGGGTRPAHPGSHICEAGCLAASVCRQTGHRRATTRRLSRPHSAFLADRTPRRTVGGGRESGAAAPHIAPDGRRATRHQRRPMSTVRCVLLIKKKTLKLCVWCVGVWSWMLGRGCVSRCAAARASSAAWSTRRR